MKATANHHKKLQQLGFSEKQVKVYMASLGLGPSPVQKIAEKAGVKRATTYVMISSLLEHGLMVCLENGKKVCYAARSPQQLVAMLESEKVRLSEKEKLVAEMLPDLVAFHEAAGGSRVELIEVHTADKAKKAKKPTKK
jgi:sugar-specific transcriptional regulator TrmB